MYQVWLRWVARPEFARAECLSCQSQPSLFRAKESPLNIEIIGKGQISVTTDLFQKVGTSAQLCCCITVSLWDLMVTWVNVLCGQSSHIDSQHSLPYFSGWPICSQWLSCSSGNLVASLFQTAKIFVFCLISTILFLLSVNPGLVWIPSYALSILFMFLQILRALTPFHQENVIVQLFVHIGGLCQNTMHDG